MNFEIFSSTVCFTSWIFIALSGIGSAAFAALVAMLRRKRQEAARLSDQLSRCKVRAGNLEEECRRLAWGAHDQLKSLQKDLESRSGYFERQRDSTPHKDHEQRALGYREASATMGQMMEEMEKRGGGRQKVKVDL